ncbi:MAG: CdaR family protein [candidate division Zixibacteria bacterium]|nr:CdaR family protein [candidate division Zixibacteria bacterium]MDD5424991.1 CdaR family protein [candidate division Zixibacteria bacterium]
MKSIFKNFWLKVIAVIMGFLIWFHVVTEKNYTYELKLPISLIVLKENLTLSKKPPDSLSVKVSASGKQLLREEWRNRGLHIDATQFDIGTYDLTLNNKNVILKEPSSNVTLDNIVFPTTINLQIDEKASMTISVTPDLEVIADDGFAVSQPISTTPSEVEIIGPRSLLRRFQTVFTEQKKLTGLKNNVIITLPLIPPAGYGISLKPDSITLSIKVIPVKTRVYDNLPVVVFNAPVDKTYSLFPPTVTVELTGPPSDIDLLNRKALTVSIDYKQIDREGLAPVKIDCPSNFRVKKSSADSVKIIIR